jgi:hypothetical protein
MNPLNQLLVVRLYDSGIDTTGKLYFKSDKLRYVQTLEDSYNKEKVPGSTRIPAGQYEIKLRREGTHFEKYCNHSIPEIAELTKRYGILHLQNVPNFQYVLIHILNTALESQGCLGVGHNVNNNSKEPGYLTNSSLAYIYLFKHIAPVFDRQEQLFINILDFDRDVQNQFKG